MKPDIHPDYVGHDRDLHLRQHLHDAQHRRRPARSAPTSAAPATRSTRASRRSSTPVAASPASRRATARSPRRSSDPDAGGPAPSPSMAARDGRRRSSFPVHRTVPTTDTRGPPHERDLRRRRAAARRARRDRGRARRPGGARGPGRGPQLLGRRYAELGQVVAAYRTWQAADDDLADAARAGRRRRRRSPTSCPRCGPRRDEPPSGCAAAARPARPRRRPRRHPRDQGGGGRRGVGAVRRRPAADVPALRRAPGLERPRCSTSTESDLGGYKDVAVAVKTRAPPTPATASGRS